MIWIGMVALLGIGAAFGTIRERKEWQKATGKNRARDLG